MTRAAQPRGAAAKTMAAIKREAAADKAIAKIKARPPILAELAASTTTRQRWSFTPEQRADIDEVFAAVAAGSIVCSCKRLAGILKTRYDLPWAVPTIRDRLLDLRNSR